MTITHPFPLMALPLLLSALPLLLGLVVARRNRRLLLLLFLITVTLGGTLGATFLVPQIVVTKESIRERRGWWFRPTTQTFVLSQLESIEIEPVSDAEGRTHYYWHFHRKSGDIESTETHDPSDLWDLRSDVIISALRDARVEVKFTNPPPDPDPPLNKPGR